MIIKDVFILSIPVDITYYIPVIGYLKVDSVIFYYFYYFSDNF